MLGLGLVLSLGKKLYSDLIGRLLQKLATRGTYSENLASSRSLVTEIDNAGVLDDATILLTPTAYSNTRVHSVKTYTGDELVNSNNWINNTSGTATITDGVITFVNGTGYLTQGIISANTTYKFSVTLSNVSQGQLMLTTEGGVNSKIVSTNGINDFYLKSTSSGALFIFAQSSFTGSIDNVSVTEADADFDFDRASSATRINSDGLVQDMQSITDVELVQNGDFEELGDDLVTNGTFDTDSDWDLSNATIQDGYLTLNGSSVWARQNILSLNKTYYFELDAVVRSGTARIQAGGGADNFSEGFYIIGSTGFHSGYISSLGVDTFLYLIRNSTCDIDIDNVSVQQVDPNDRWNAETGWDISNGKANKTGAVASNFYQYNVFTSGNTYKLTFDISNSNDGRLLVYVGGTSVTEDITNASNGTYTFYADADNANIVFRNVTFTGSIDNVSVKDITFSEDVDLARINYDSNGENGHWLLEPTSTNLVTYSEDFEDSSWSNASVGTTPTLEGGYTAPDGSNSAYKISNANQDSFWYSSSVIGADNSRTIWARTVSGTGTAQLTSHNSNTNNTFNLTETWQRFEVNGTTSGIGSTNFYAVDFRGSGTLTELLIWGAQAEALSYATSYIPTYGSTVTRAAETLNGSGNSTLINSTEGVLYAEIAALNDSLLTRVIQLSDGTQNNRIFLGYWSGSNEIRALLQVGGATQFFSGNSSYNTLNYNKIAFKWKVNDFALWINGVEVVTDTVGTTFSVNTLNTLGFESLGSSHFYGKCKALAVFDRALTDQELTDLTS